MNNKIEYKELFLRIEGLKVRMSYPYSIYPFQTSIGQVNLQQQDIILDRRYPLHQLLASSGWLTQDIGAISDNREDRRSTDKPDLGYAFSAKYGSFATGDDARSVSLAWQHELHRAWSHLDPLASKGAILHIGCDSHYEFSRLHKDAASVTLVDISGKLLDAAANVVPGGKKLLTAATELTGVADKSIDLYIALRVFCAFHFDQAAAIRMAARKLKKGGSILLSISNGYRAIDDTILPGQIVDSPPSLSLSKPFDLVYTLLSLLHKQGFRELFLVPGSTELFLGGTYFPDTYARRSAPIIHVESVDPIPLCFYHQRMPTSWLGNFSDHPISVEGETWATVEHYFQAAKFSDRSHRTAIRDIPSPDLAKKYAWNLQHEVKDNWEEVRIDVMRQALKAKFEQYPVLKKALRQTGNRELIETSQSDHFWGSPLDRSGDNRMGRLLMQIRSS